MSARQHPPPLRGAVVGLGMIGRHHARLLQAMPEVAFAGAVDPGGDAYRAVHDPALVLPSLDALLARGRPDFAVVATPTDRHLATVERLAAEGVHVLVEKPLAATSAEAAEVAAVCERAGVLGAVGHVERCNPALVELHRRLGAGQLGDLFLLTTERVGPFPGRISDVGVVLDLATHDIDTLRWLGGAGIAQVAAQVQHRAGRDHEDLVLMTGALESGVSFNGVVDWLSPVKVRRTRALGENGMLVADTLSGDLTFYENASVASEWQASQQFRGVAEGDVTRYALARREPLLVELERFCAHVRGEPATGVVSLQDGLEIVRTAEAVLESARSRATVALEASR